MDEYIYEGRCIARFYRLRPRQAAASPASARLDMQVYPEVEGVVVGEVVSEAGGPTDSEEN
tara:strand:+ start:630 stop:812 length:183 start_codon:yes stop_codon:yes gene_type:complete